MYMKHVATIIKKTVLMFVLMGNVVYAMDKDQVEDAAEQSSHNASQDNCSILIIQEFIAQGNFEGLEEFLVDARVCQSRQTQQTAHDEIVRCVLKILGSFTPDIVKPYFTNLPEGTFKLAIRLIYAIKNMKNLDDYDCVQLLCPNRVDSRLHLITIQSAPKPNDNKGIRSTFYAVPAWHIDLSHHQLCTESYAPALLCLLPHIVKRIYPGNAFAFNPPLKSIDLSNNDIDLDSFSHLIPHGVEIKETTAEMKQSMWGLGQIYLIDDVNDRAWLTRAVQNGLKDKED